MLFWIPETRLRLPQVNKQVNSSGASEVSTPSSIFIFYFFLIHRRALFALNQSEARFAELGEYSQNMFSNAFWTRTRFAKQKFAQFRTNYVRRLLFFIASTNNPNYVREANVRPVQNQLCSPIIFFLASTNNPNYVREANVRPIKNQLKAGENDDVWLFCIRGPKPNWTPAVGT